MNSQEILNYYRVTPKCSEILQWIQPQIKEFILPILDQFYDFFSSQPLTKEKIPVEMIPFLKQKQKDHWDKIFNGKFDNDWFEESIQIGKIHLEKGITPTYYISGYNFILTSLIDNIQSISKKAPFTKAEILKAVNTVVFMDLDLALTSYNEELYIKTEDESYKKYADNVLDRSVDISMASNDIAYKNARLMQSLKITDADVQNISASAEEMASSIESIQASISDTTIETKELSNVSNNSKDLIIETSQDLQNIADKVKENLSRIEKLAKLSNTITDEIKAIDDIANQVKVLALNATIEASRAGAAGKGFAVVAREVNKLSEKTSSTTNKIRDVIKDLDGKINETVEAMNLNNTVVKETNKLMKETESHNINLNTSIIEIARRMEEINSILTEQSNAVETISQSITNLAKISSENVEQIGDSMDSISSIEDVLRKQVELISERLNNDSILKVAQSDHALWMKTLAEVLCGYNSIESHRLNDHTQCRFGKWYYGKGKDLYSTNQIFKNIEQPHIDVHRYGIEAVKLYNQGDEIKAMEMYYLAKKESLIVIEQLKGLNQVK